MILRYAHPYLWIISSHVSVICFDFVCDINRFENNIVHIQIIKAEKKCLHLLNLSNSDLVYIFSKYNCSRLIVYIHSHVHEPINEFEKGNDKILNLHF